VEKSLGNLSSIQRLATGSCPFVITIIIFPGVSVFSTWMHQELRRRSSRTVMSSCLLLMVTVMRMSKVVSSMPSTGMEAPWVRNSLFF